MTATALQVAVIDDYQDAAREFGPWAELAGRADVTVFDDHVTDVGALAGRLAPFDVIVATRERTRFPRQVLERLPGCACWSAPAWAAPTSTWPPPASSASRCRAPAAARNRPPS